MRRSIRLGICMLAMGLVCLFGTAAHAQITTAQLSGHVMDPQGRGVANAGITVRNLATGATRDTKADDSGYYQFVGLPPGHYELTVASSAGFAKLVNSDITLTIGQEAGYDPHLQLESASQTVNVTAETEVIETARTSSASTVDQQQINNLPINGRNYINFTLTNSEVHRDSSPTIGAAPTSGLNFNGQRARSNEVSVDGADAVDNSVNGIRATVSQEAVQEFQILQSNYMPEFGRAIGGVVNIVTKSGSNQVHGNLFGFLRNKNIQARNPFSFQVNPATGALQPVKQAYTRAQGGATIGGPLQKDKTFYFFSYEITRRHETGFNSIGQNNFGLSTGAIPCLPFPISLSSDQFTFYRNNLNALTGNGAACASGNPVIQAQITGLQQAALITGASSNVAVNADMNKNVDGTTVPISTTLGVPAAFGSKFFPPAFSGLLASLPTPSFVGLDSLRGNYPANEGTSLWSLRLDHIWNSANTTFLRASVSPSTITGIQVNGQNQVSGTNAFSRTSDQISRDVAIVAQHSTAISSSLFNEFRFQYARRGLHYGFSQGPGGGNVAVDILGAASLGREPFSSVDRIERRTEFTDNLSWIKGRHTFKFGADINLIQVRSNTNQIFELDFGGIYRFSALSAANTGLPTALSSVQAYGLGIPGSFLQGVGNSGRTFDNPEFGVYAQDSWKLTPRLTLNYGVRYDVELSPLFTPKTAINAAAEQSLGVIEGIPRDYNNVSPRAAFAWDPWGDGKTVVRAGYGLFYDHPLLAVAFLSATADGAQSVQLTFGPGAPSSAALTPLNAVNVMNASTLFQGVLNASPAFNLGYQANGNQQRFDPFFSNSFFTNQNFLSSTTGLPLTVLPFTFPVSANFRFGVAQQGGLSIEHEIGNGYKVGVAYTYIHAAHLNRPRDTNVTNDPLLIQNFTRAAAVGLAPSDPRTIALPVGGSAAACPAPVVAAFPAGTQFINISGGGSLALVAPGALGSGFTGQNCGGASVGFIGTPAIFNYFRPSGPNPSFGSLGLPFGTLQTLAALANFPAGKAGVPVPFSDLQTQESTGSSVYHGVTFTFSKRFTRHFEFLSNYTYSHAIDDSTDLQSLLVPQDNNNPQLDRGNSTFDQRHRWVTSGVFDSPYTWKDEGFLHKALADFTISPIVEVASGRPFNVLTGTDFNMDFSPFTDRPSIVPAGTAGSVTSAFLPGKAFSLPTVCSTGSVAGLVPPLGCTGNLGRNVFFTPKYATWDMRLSRKIALGDRANLELIADMFNLLNRNNTSDVNVLCDPLSGNCPAGQPTAAFDARQFQFAAKINF